MADAPAGGANAATKGTDLVKLEGDVQVQLQTAAQAGRRARGDGFKVQP